VLLGLKGLRVSEACATNIEDLGLERGHRTLQIIGKGTKPATTPLVPRTASTIDRANGERIEGPILRRRDGQRLDRRTPPESAPSDNARDRQPRPRPSLTLTAPIRGTRHEPNGNQSPATDRSGRSESRPDHHTNHRSKRPRPKTQNPAAATTPVTPICKPLARRHPTPTNGPLTRHFAPTEPWTVF